MQRAAVADARILECFMVNLTPLDDTILSEIKINIPLRSRKAQ